MMGTYEIVAVLKSDLDEEGLAAALDRITQRVTEHGGSIVSQERWGKRKLAYPIKKHRDGYYTLFVFTLDPSHIMPLRQVIGLNEELLRFTFASHRAKPVPAAAAVSASPAAATAPAAPAASAPSQAVPAPEAPHV